ncbi:hypothetical protein TcasGA2_TC031563 [Tribolium castaneum]|uniref:Uncharacterized protein n=1 Tax=Tribolium castaneum TaxID=7070 RepID=A0A139WPQ2_TRICA|nr:hypothetical protein TcasGA2_TC031563 [Tribolium castaneum]
MQVGLKLVLFLLTTLPTTHVSPKFPLLHFNSVFTKTRQGLS